MKGTEQTWEQWLRARSEAVAVPDKDGTPIAVGDIVAWYSHDEYQRGVVVDTRTDPGSETTVRIETPSSYFSFVPSELVRVQR